MLNKWCSRSSSSRRNSFEMRKNKNISINSTSPDTDCKVDKYVQKSNPRLDLYYAPRLFFCPTFSAYSDKLEHKSNAERYK